MKRRFGCFDQVDVINLDRDSERMNRISPRLGKLNGPVEGCSAVQPENRLRFADPVMISSAGCVASREALLRLVLERGHDTALLLEDDAVFRDDVQEWMAKIAPQLATQPWDMFYLGLHLIESQNRVTANLG